ncbi:MAG TPA: sporangiospore maturation cell wall hydrolase GsmA [Micromonosporaceae bacterium]|nr:sporangiospore maturation cell wall hydrolase GsmA [Micromonosporaceae bacterium]
MDSRWVAVALRTAAALAGAAGGLLVVGPPAGAAPAGAAVVRTGGGPLNVRVGAAVTHARVGTLPEGTSITIGCQVIGQTINGWVRRTAAWDRLSNGRYVSDAYVAWRPSRPALPLCGPAAAARTPRAAVSVVAWANTGGGPLNVRAGAGTGYRRLGTLPSGARLAIACQVQGQPIAIGSRANPMWDRIGDGRYVSDRYVAWRPARPALPWCDQQPAAMPPWNHATFIAFVAGPARETMRLYRVPASVTIAQAILESGWGGSELTRVDHNYFGIKCFGTPGPIAVGCRTYPTTECSGGRCFATRAPFRAYRGPIDSFVDHGRFLVVNERYRRAFGFTRDPNRFAIEIRRAGYATGPRYAESLIWLMRHYNLYRYDR